MVQAGIPYDRSKKVPIEAANSTSLRCSGSVTLSMEFEGQTIETEALVARNLAQDVLVSYTDLVRLGIISPNFPSRAFDTTSTYNVKAKEYQELSLDSIIDQYPDVFDASKVTPLAGEPMVIHLNKESPDYKPRRTTSARKVPLHFQEEADRTLQ